MKDGFSERSDLDENGEECTCGHCPMCEHEMAMMKESKMNKTNKTTVTVCSVCGSENVQHAMWVSVNTGDVNDEFGTWCSGDNSWCEDCGEHTELVEREKPAPKKATKKARKT